MRHFPKTPLILGWLLLGAGAGQGAVPLPLQIYQNATTYNLQSRRGVPISAVTNSPPGSDGRMPTGLNESGTPNQPTTGQFRGLISYGGLPGLNQADWKSIQNSPRLRGTNAFSGAVAKEMRLPVGLSNGVVTLIFRQTMVGAPYQSRQVSFAFGSEIPAPITDENGRMLTNVSAMAYWLAEPYSQSHHTNDQYYWSPNAGKVYAIQSGPITVTWRKATYAATAPADFAANPQNYFVDGGNYYRLYPAQYVVSSSAIKAPRKIYWTERDFSKLGVLVSVPTARVGAVNIVYNNNFPKTVAAEYVGVGHSSPTDGSTNQSLTELRTLWYDQQQGNIHAYNQEGRVFLELLGDKRADGQTREPLGTEIVDVAMQPPPADVTIELGEKLTPPPPGSIEELSPQPVLQLAGPSFAYLHNIAGSDAVELYATCETANLNDYMVYWLESGVAGLKWPASFARYQLIWPADVARYSHYLRPLVATEDEAMATAVPLATENVPTIKYQDPLDHPRAKLTADYRFYTFLEPACPAHRTLLMFTAGEDVAFERVFSWLDQNLKGTNFAGSVAANLSAWNSAKQSMTWPTPLTAPRVVTETVDVGQRLLAPTGELGAGGNYLAGHIHVSAGDSYNVNTYLDPFVAGFDIANRGAIIPVNAIPGKNILEVWWFRTNAASAGANAANLEKGFQPVRWPSALGHYSLRWPAKPMEIVLASQLGSAGNPNLDPLAAQGTLYVQNSPALPGYNPNEEHAILSAGTAYATRDDLNITASSPAYNGQNYSSAPFVLVDYQAQDGRPAMAVFKVLREKPEAGYVFDYVAPAGQILQPPMPLPLLGKPVAGTGDYAVCYNTEPTQQVGDLPGAWLNSRDTNGPFAYYNRFTYRDRHHDFWIYRGLHAGLPALQAGAYSRNAGVFVPLANATAVVGQPFSFTLHVSRQDEYLALSAPGGLPGWLSLSGLSLKGTPSSRDVGTNTVSLVIQDLYDQSRVTNRLAIRVSTNGTVAAQAPLRMSYTNSQSGLMVTFSNRPPFLGLPPGPSNSFSMRYYYKTEASFAWPGIANPPPSGSIVPYLRAVNTAGGYSGGDGTSTGTVALDIVYRPVWPVRDPSDSSKPVASLPFGATLTKPAFGLPGVRDWKTAQILYQQSIAANITNTRPSAVLHDPTRAKYADLAANSLMQLPGGVRSEMNQGKYYFPNLPPHLASRVFLDPNRGAKGSLVLQGQFVDEIMGESYLLLNVLRSSDLDAVKALCPTADPDSGNWNAAIDSLATSVETFYENPNQPGAYIPNPTLTVSVGVQDLATVADGNIAVDSYALSAAGPGSGYITLLEAGGTAFTQPGDPVAMHIFKVGGSLYTGELKVISAANPLSELVTFQHTADLAGRADQFAYQWKIAAPVDGMPPVGDATMSRYLSLISGSNLVRYILGGAGVRVLGDNYVVMRYRPINPAHPLYKANPTDADWSAWTTPKLAEGWIKRVLAGINPFNQRVTDLMNNRVNTDVSLLTQAGHRWEGDVALNLESINNYGLIEIYETVLRRGRMLSIESGYNYGPANDALLLAAGYLNDLYMLVGNEAWADAANPTIGIGTKDRTYGDIATALFAFKGQEPSLLAEELALLRGRDDFLQPGVEVSPIYNRLVWNYTRGIDAGEVIYALNYNIQPAPNNSSGAITATDAAYMFPQGHGDAYGHYLTALKGYYSLLLNSCFDWVPRIEAVNVLGQPVSVDYLDERKFAAAAAAVARAGRQVFDLTWRQDYQPVHTVGWAGFGATRANTQRQVPSTRYWGMDHWASRVGQGAYLNWIVGNALLPEVDTNPAHSGIQIIDRTTVPELLELPVLADGLQTALDNAEGGLSPLGIPEGSLAFDINPAAVVGTDNGTHFEQIYQRAAATLNNAVAAFDDAKDVTRLMRSEQDSLTEFQTSVNQQEQAYTNALIELYGTPYPDDTGPGKTYKQDYAGPDIVHFTYVETPEVHFPELWYYTEATTYQVDIQDLPTWWKNVNNYALNFSDVVQATDAEGNFNTNYVEGVHYLTFNIGTHGFYDKPASWTGQRASPGKIQQAISDYIAAHTRLQVTLADAAGGKSDLDRDIRIFDERQLTLRAINSLGNTTLDVQQDINNVQTAYNIASKWLLMASSLADDLKQAMADTIPDELIVGTAAGGNQLKVTKMAVYVPALIAKNVLLAGDAIGFTASAELTKQKQEQILQWTKEIASLQLDQDTKDGVSELGDAMAELQAGLTTINERLRELDDAQRGYRAVVAEGLRVQQERAIFRQRAAAVVQGFRTRDAAFRLFRNEKLERYKTLFDLAARYALLAANAYDYETGLLNTSAGRGFLKRIINSRALGVVRDGQPQYAGSDTGDPGLSSALAEMKADWDVLRGRLGFNNPDAYGTTVSLRTEGLRILPGTEGDANWADTLNRARMDNILADQDVLRYCMQIDAGNGLPVPGIVLMFSTTIADGYNLFGRELAAGDHAFSPSSFATKIFGVGVALDGYLGMDNPAANSGAVGGSGATSPADPSSWYLNDQALSATPYVYLIPVGVDSMRTPPLGDASTIRTWTVNDVCIPMPFNIGASDFSTKPLWQSADSLTEPLFAVRKHQAFRPVSSAAYFSRDLYGAANTLQRSQYTNNRLVARSVWNSQWKLVIPGRTLLNDPNEGLNRFIQTVKDIKLHWVTYSYSGN